MTAWYVVVAVLLLLANAFFVAAEFALIAASPAKLEKLALAGDPRAKLALRAGREVSLMLSGAQLGITMASLGLGFVAEPAVARLIEAGLEGVAELPGGVLHPTSFVVALALISFLHMVVGEMAPKNVAIAEPENSALWLAIPFRVYTVLFRPVIRFFNFLANGATRLLGVEPQDERFDVHSPTEIRMIVGESARTGHLDRFQHRLLRGAASFGARDAASVMVPRTEVIATPLPVTPAELEGMVIESGLSRIPVYGRGLDDVIGFFHAKDLLAIPSDRFADPLASDFIRPMLVVPESLKLHSLMRDMRRRRQHFALVADEHGGTAGVVTLEDILEELVGEIQDEYDVSELGIERVGDDRFLIPGTLRLDEAADRLGVELPDGDYETVAGFIMDRLGRVPKRRDSVEHDGWKLQVRTMQRRRVVQILIEKQPQAAAR